MTEEKSTTIDTSNRERLFFDNELGTHLNALQTGQKRKNEMKATKISNLVRHGIDGKPLKEIAHRKKC